jgi:hypothetical protein
MAAPSNISPKMERSSPLSRLTDSIAPSSSGLDLIFERLTETKIVAMAEHNSETDHCSDRSNEVDGDDEIERRIWLKSRKHEPVL